MPQVSLTRAVLLTPLCLAVIMVTALIDVRAQSCSGRQQGPYHLPKERIQVLIDPTWGAQKVAAVKQAFVNWQNVGTGVTFCFDDCTGTENVTITVNKSTPSTAPDGSHPQASTQVDVGALLTGEVGSATIDVDPQVALSTTKNRGVKISTATNFAIVQK